MAKQFSNGRERAVTDAIDGFLLSSAAVDLCRLDDFPDIKVVLRADWDRSRVALVAGGGAGHEPAHAGFVGAGMLTAAVCGDVFASPSVDAVLAGILAVTGAPGCLLIVKNYTGDRLNFGLAAERARAAGLRVEMVVVGDDVALPEARQPRGIAGTLFVHKLAGAAAEAGRSLEEVRAIAADAAAQTKSLGLALSGCTLPGGETSDRLALHQAELGLGIHGEPGARLVDMGTADHLVGALADALLQTLTDDTARYALLLNTLGAVPPLEAALVTRAFANHPLADRISYIVGPAPLMTALDMHGVSLSLLALDEARLAGLLAAAGPAAWPAAKRFARPVLRPRIEVSAAIDVPASAHAGTRHLVVESIRLLHAIAPDIDALDARVGDGDTGSTFAGAARAIEQRLETLPFADGATLLRMLGDILLRSAGGSSGVLLATFFIAASTGYAQSRHWPTALRVGLDRLKEYGGAQPGDRTMVDALEPALGAFGGHGALAAMAAAARGGADATSRMDRARAGRSSYLREDVLAGTPDPGAEAVARLLEHLAKVATLPPGDGR